MRPARALRLSVLSLTAACSSVRWSGGGPSAAPGPGPASLAVSSGPVRQRLTAVVPETPPERLRAALFYSDLGPDRVDVSAYPTQQRYNYGIYKEVCSRCHTLARSINAPIVGRGWWEFYMAGMRVRSRWHGRPLSSDEIKAVLDFLEYDSRERKSDRAREFEEITDELTRRFDRELERRVSDLQKANPRALPHPAAP